MAATTPRKFAKLTWAICEDKKPPFPGVNRVSIPKSNKKDARPDAAGALEKRYARYLDHFIGDPSRLRP